MFSPSSNLKTMHPLQVKPSSSTTSSPPSSTISSMKLKRIIHTLLVSHMCRIIRAISKVKQVIVEILNDPKNNNNNNNNNRRRRRTIHLFPSNKKHYNKIILGSFRLHYNWCSSKSSHVLPVPQPVYDEGLHPHSTTQLCYESAIHSSNVANNNSFDEDCPESQLAGYLRWLEEKKIQEIIDDDGNKKGEKKYEEQEEMNEIDVLAEMFIANCHEKFRLEKQESDRRFQEMLARSM